MNNQQYTKDVLGKVRAQYSAPEDKSATTVAYRHIAETADYQVEQAKEDTRVAEKSAMDAQLVLDAAVAAHVPAYTDYTFAAYQRIANSFIVGVTETFPRRKAAIGSHVGDRMWSAAGAASTFTVPLLLVDQLIRPARIGSHIGDGLWGTRSRYLLRVRYYQSVVDPKPIWDALMAFKQAHIFLLFEDITGAGGRYGQN